MSNRSARGKAPAVLWAASCALGLAIAATGCGSSEPPDGGASPGVESAIPAVAPGQVQAGPVTASIKSCLNGVSGVYNGVSIEFNNVDSSPYLLAVIMQAENGEAYGWNHKVPPGQSVEMFRSDRADEGSPSVIGTAAYFVCDASNALSLVD